VSSITRETATVFPLFKELRGEDGQVASYAILVEKAQVGTTARRIVSVKGKNVTQWVTRIKGQRKQVVGATRAASVMAALEGSFVAS
jgi:hypothetical protein